jgi:AcrR family transcriptional regulator
VLSIVLGEVCLTRKSERILDVGARLFATKGFRNTNAAEIARETDVAEGTIFYHFKSKEELFLEIMKDFRRVVTERLDGLDVSHDSAGGLRRMELTISFYLSMASSMEDRFLLLHRHDAYELSEQNPLFRAELERIYACFIDLFDRAVAEGQKDGSITTDIPARRLAMIVFALVDSVVRLNTYKLYDAGSLYGDLLKSVGRLLRK